MRKLLILIALASVHSEAKDISQSRLGLPSAKSIILNVWTALNRKGYGCPNKAILFDIAKCFDSRQSIDHDFILNNIGEFQFKGHNLELIPKSILAEWLKCGFILKNDSILHATNAGVPQGRSHKPAT